MAITELFAYGPLTVLPDGQIQVCRIRTILDTDGSEILRKESPVVLKPGQDVSQYSPLVQDIAAVVWTPKVIADYKKVQE